VKANLQFECETCSRNEGRARRWSTPFGAVRFYFNLEENWTLSICAKVYPHPCKTCGQDSHFVVPRRAHDERTAGTFVDVYAKKIFSDCIAQNEQQDYFEEYSAQFSPQDIMIALALFLTQYPGFQVP